MEINRQFWEQVFEETTKKYYCYVGFCSLSTTFKEVWECGNEQKESIQKLANKFLIEKQIPNVKVGNYMLFDQIDSPHYAYKEFGDIRLKFLNWLLHENE